MEEEEAGRRVWACVWVAERLRGCMRVPVFGEDERRTGQRGMWSPGRRRDRWERKDNRHEPPEHKPKVIVLAGLVVVAVWWSMYGKSESRKVKSQSSAVDGVVKTSKEKQGLCLREAA